MDTRFWFPGCSGFEVVRRCHVMPGLSRPSTTLDAGNKQDVDARHKAGHDSCYGIANSSSPGLSRRSRLGGQGDEKKPRRSGAKVALSQIDLVLCSSQACCSGPTYPTSRTKSRFGRHRGRRAAVHRATTRLTAAVPVPWPVVDGGFVCPLLLCLSEGFCCRSTRSCCSALVPVHWWAGRSGFVP